MSAHRRGVNCIWPSSCNKQYVEEWSRTCFCAETQSLGRGGVRVVAPAPELSDVPGSLVSADVREQEG